MKSARPSLTPPAAPFTVALAELETKLAEVRERRQFVIHQRRARENLGEHKNVSFIEPERDRQAAALRMLNGAAEAHVQPQNKRLSYSDIVGEQAVLDRAIEIGSLLHEQLRIKARAELGETRAHEHQALMAQRAQIVIGLERNSQTIDILIAGTDLQGYPLPLGRLSNTASPTYKFCETAVQQGWLTQKEFVAEYEAARKADLNR